MKKLTYKTPISFYESFENGLNKEFATHVVDSCLKLKDKEFKRPKKILEVDILDTGEVFEIMLSKEDIKYTLENNLKLFENAEEYEQCVRIFKALKTMSN